MPTPGAIGEGQTSPARDRLFSNRRLYGGRIFQSWNLQLSFRASGWCGSEHLQTKVAVDEEHPRRNSQPAHSRMLLLDVRPAIVNSATFEKHQNLRLARLLQVNRCVCVPV